MEHVFAAVDIQQLFSPARNIPTFATLVNVIIKNAFVLAGLISFALLVLGGFGMVLGAGGGDTKRLEQNKQMITYAVIGLLIVVTSYWLVQIIEKITGVPIFNLGV